ncbi:MAG: glycosyltransferase family 4 protein [Patescibacteria group bacterium]
MKIAQIAPIWYRVPPKKYGGTEQVVSALTEGLVARGHEVTLFASEDSVSRAKLVSTVPKGIIEMGFPFSEIVHPLAHLLTAVAKPHQFDILHFHFTFVFDYVTLALAAKLPNAIFTLHAPLPTDPERSHRLKLWQGSFKAIPLVSISNSQRAGVPLNFVRTVYNGIDLAQFSFNNEVGEKLLYLSRISVQKGTATAIAVAQKLGKPLLLAGKVDPHSARDVVYFESEVKPLLSRGGIEEVGEINVSQKSEIYGQAKALLFPIAWEEPFGLVMIESMACGTPVVAFARGSVPEVVKDGVTGFIVEPEAEDVTGPAATVSRASLQFNCEITASSPSSPPRSEVKTPHGRPSSASPVTSAPSWIIKKRGIEGLVEAVARIYAMPPEEYRAMRRACRAHVEENFTVERMVEGYERIYEQLRKGRNP